MPDGESVRITFAYQPEDHPLLVKMPSKVQVPQGSALPPSPKSEKFSFSVSTFAWAGILLIGVLLYFGLKGDKAFSIEFVPQLQVSKWSIWLIVILSITTLLSVLIVFAVLRGLKRKNANTLKDIQQEVEISFEGIRWTTADFSSLYRWSYFDAFSESKTAFNVSGLARSRLFIFPKRVMTPKQMKLARSFFEMRIGVQGDSTAPLVARP